MSVKQMSLVWDLDLAPNERLVLLAYADHADDDGDNVYPSLPRIARKTGYGVDQTRRITRQLMDDGLMEMVEEGIGRGNTHRYRMTLENGSKMQPFAPAKDGNMQPFKEKVASEEKVAPRPQKVASGPVKGGIAMPPEPSENRQEPSESTSSLSTDVLKSGDRPENGDGPPPEKKDEKETKPQDLKQYAVAELMRRVNAARQRGSPIHDPLDRDRAQYARFFATRSKFHDVDTLLHVFDYMVAKASGELEGEPKAWCGFDTALDAVLAGWRPANPFRDEEERRRILEDNARAEAELLEGVLDGGEAPPGERPSPAEIRRMLAEASAEMRSRTW